MRNLDTAEAKSGGFAAAARLRCHQAAAAKHGKVKGFLRPWATLDAALTRSAQWVLSFLVLAPGRCHAVGTLRAAGVRSWSGAKPLGQQLWDRAPSPAGSMETWLWLLRSRASAN